MAAEPGAPRVIAGSELELESAFAVFGDFADLKSRWFAGHSRGVTELAAQGAERLGLPEADRQTLERAALLHDLGRVAISNEVWDRPGPLGARSGPPS